MVANRRKLFFVLILAMTLCGCSLSKKENKEELNLLDYVKAEYMGTQGNLKVSLQIDGDKVRETYQTLKEEKSTLDAIVFYEFMDSITLEYDKRADTYCDGDKIKVEFGWNESLSEECPFRVWRNLCGWISFRTNATRQ